MEKFSVDLTCRSSDLADHDNRFRCDVTRGRVYHITILIVYFASAVFQGTLIMTTPRRNTITETIGVPNKNLKIVSVSQNYLTCAQSKILTEYMKRVIVHPSFLNVSYKEAENALVNMDQGDAIFRPSSKVH